MRQLRTIRWILNTCIRQNLQEKHRKYLIYQAHYFLTESILPGPIASMERKRRSLTSS